MLHIMITPDYYGASAYVKWIAFEYAFWGYYLILMPLIIHKNKQNKLLIFTGIAAGVNVFSNFVLLKLNGIAGSAQALFITYLVLFLCVFIYVSKLYGFQFRKRCLPN
ncbi:MAG: polysaccharide biosynthesis C-terminal domain-containing protein [Saprospiraceae bacterium]|nr:polysaccharide biosynthesis C-terminal domain-containing protein [Saprospiraceae bacterium]